MDERIQQRFLVMETFYIGLLLVTLAGFGTGTMAWPMKNIQNFSFEHFLFASMFTGLLIIPWTVFLMSVPSPFSIIRSVGVQNLLIANVASISWGIANILYLTCIIRIGAAMTGATLTAVGMSVGVLMPMLVKGSGLFSNAPDLISRTGALIITGLVVMMAGVALVTKAGLLKERLKTEKEKAEETKKHKSGFLNGMLMAILAGILSSGISLAFVYGQSPVAHAVAEVGGSDIVQSFAVWALTIAGGALVNISYAIYLMVRRKTILGFLSGNSSGLYGIVIGFQFILSIVLMGKGMLLLGVLGASIGFAIQQSTQIMGNQMVGLWRGEWKGVQGKPKQLMYAALITIFIATCIIAYSNSYATT